MNLKKLIGSDFLKNTIVVVAGTIGAQSIALLAQPFLRRIYPPEAFGHLSIFLSLTGILVIISSLRYELTITLPKETEDAQSLLAGALLINFFFSLLIEILILVFQTPILNFLNIHSEYQFLIHLVAPGVFMFGIYQAVSYWLIRNIKFTDTSYIKLNRRLFEFPAQLTFKNFQGNIGLIWGELCGRFFLAVSSIYFVLKSGYHYKSISLQSIKKNLKDYSDYPKYSTLPTLLNSIGLLVPAIIVNKFFGAKETGYFDACLLVLSVPVSFVSVSISNVLTQKISESYRNQTKISGYIHKLFLILFSISILGVIMIKLFAPDFFEMFFGKEYRTAGEYATVLSVGFAARFVVSTFAVVFSALNRIKHGVLWQYLYFITIVSLFFIPHKNIKEFILIYVIIESFMYLIYMFQILWECKNYDNKIP
jgi:O-antigen/teichoic acid export membrane protein